MSNEPSFVISASLKPSGLDSNAIIPSTSVDDVGMSKIGSIANAIVGSAAPSEAVVDAKNRTNDPVVSEKKKLVGPSVQDMLNEIQRKKETKRMETDSREKLSSKKHLSGMSRKQRRTKEKNPTHPPVQYSFARDYENQTSVSLVLFTTAEANRVESCYDPHT